MLNQFQFLSCSGSKNIKTNALYLMAIILLLSCFSGCSHHVSPQSGIEAKTVSPLSTTTNDLKSKMSPYKNDEWQAYRTILSGNFTLINEDDCRSEMEYLYKLDSQNGKCGWKYILMDFNKDGIDELFIQLTPDHDSALFRFVDGNIKCIYIDDVETNCFTEPLKGGTLLETYNEGDTLTKTIFNYDSEFKLEIKSSIFQ